MSKKARILIVEDEQMLAMSLESVFEELGYPVTGSCISPKEAMASLDTDLPDLIMLDINLRTERDGILLAEKIRQRLDIPMIFMSGHFDTDSLNRIKKIPNCRMLEKPIDVDILKDTIEAAVQDQVIP